MKLSLVVVVLAALAVAAAAGSVDLKVQDKKTGDALVAALSDTPGPPPQTGTCAPGDHKDDCNALIDFWRAMGSFPCNTTGPFPRGHKSCENDNGNTGFADGTPLCGWYGITCDKQTGRVKEISYECASPSCPFSGESEKRKLPDSLNLLQGLDTIVVEQVGLTGTVPASLGSLPKLKYLYLSYNGGLTGTVPASLGALSNLEVLHFEDSKLTGMVPDSFGNLTKLR